MVRFLTVLSFIFFCNKLCFAQVQLPLNVPLYQDSLNKVITSTKADSVKAEACFLLCDSWYRQDTVKAKEYLTKGKLLAAGNAYINSIYFYFLANLSYVNSIPTAEYYYMQGDSALQNFNTPRANAYKAKIWHNYGVMQQLKDDNKKFADILLNKSIPYAQLSGDSVYLGKCFFDLGLTFKNMGQKDKVEEYCNTAIKILTNAKAPYDQLVAVYIMAAENYCLLSKLPQAKVMLDTAKSILQLFPQSRYNADYYASESMYYNIKELYPQALESVNKGVELANSLNLSYNANRLLLQKYYAYFGQKNYTKAKEVLEYLQNQSNFQLGENKLQIYSGMAETFAGLGNMANAFLWMKKYKTYSDSLYEVRIKNTINELELKYNEAENKKEISNLLTQKEKANYVIKNRNLLIWLFGGASVLLSIITLLALKYYHNNKKLLVQKELNYQQQIKEQKQEQQIQLTKALLQGEEKERKRMAGDLHDGLGGMLSGVKINLSRLVNTNKENSMNTDLYKVIDQLDTSVTELRRIARNMMPESLLQLGLEASLKDLCHEITGADTKVDFQSFNISKEIPGEMQVTIYRIIQELVSNAIRHASATEIFIQCSQNENTFFITVEDNGKGFDTDTIGTHKGIGLANVKRRVEYLKGKLDIASVNGEGTDINIEFNVLT